MEEARLQTNSFNSFSRCTAGVRPRSHCEFSPKERSTREERELLLEDLGHGRTGQSQRQREKEAEEAADATQGSARRVEGIQYWLLYSYLLRTDPGSLV